MASFYTAVALVVSVTVISGAELSVRLPEDRRIIWPGPRPPWPPITIRPPWPPITIIPPFTRKTTTPNPLDDLVHGLQKAEIADLCFLVDITGSMQPYIDGVRNSILQIVQDTANQISRLRLSFVGYRDVGDNPNFEILPFTSNQNRFRNFVGGIRAKGGADTPEDVFGGLERVGNLQWDKQAGTRIMFHIADSPAHGKRYHDLRHDTYPQGDPEGRDLYQLLGRLRGDFVQYHFGKITSNTDKMIKVFSGVYGEPIPVYQIAGRPSSGRFSLISGAGVPDTAESIRGAVGESIISSFSKASARLGSADK